ncbi:MAG: alpha/beta hydrolase [Nitrososphaerota archaeon]|nr:alpha/beta hydrolase [Nitrososphaerota archaeon]
MPLRKVGDIKIYYEVHGNGEPLVLIAGCGTDSSVWLPQAQELSLRYHVITFDNRGTGRSDKPDTPYTMQMMAADVAGLLDSIGIEAAHILGYSMGGVIAQEFALTYPGRALTLILSCAYPAGAPDVVLPEPQAMSLMFDPDTIARLTPVEWSGKLLGCMCSQEFLDRHPQLVNEFVDRQSKHPTPLHGIMRQVEAMLSASTYDRLSRIKAPTLVLGGTADRVTPCENLRLLATKIPNSELVILENLGHGMFIEGTEQTNRVILTFLKRHAMGLVV